jgi:hypothetical protein
MKPLKQNIVNKMESSLQNIFEIKQRNAKNNAFAQLLPFQAHSPDLRKTLTSVV